MTATWNNTDRGARAKAFDQFAREWRCPRCGGYARVLCVCNYCHFETFGRWEREYAPIAARMGV